MFGFGKKREKANGIMDFRKDYKPTYTNADLDVALAVIINSDKAETDKNERFIEAAVKVAENWKQWIEDKGFKGHLKVEIQRFDNPIALPRVTLRAYTDEENEIFDVELGYGYNDQIMKVADFCKSL